MGHLLPLLVALTSGDAGGGFRTYESLPVHPLRISEDGKRLYALNVPDHRLAVYSLEDPSAPRLLREIPVGLEPVSVAARTDDEVWVVNRLSDSVSVVSLSRGIVLETIHAKDEPADVVFAGSPERAFVSVAGSREVRVFDPGSRRLLATIPVPGDDPRALARSEDRSRVWVAVHRSGNRTTVIPREIAPPPPPPSDPGLPPPPQVGLIVSKDDPAWASKIPFDVPDEDVIEIDAGRLAPRARHRGVGTILFDVAARPGSPELWVANTEARNLVRFEPNLRGRAVVNRVTRLRMEGGSVTSFDLDDGLGAGSLPNPRARREALAQPAGLAFDPEGRRLFVAAFGTDRIGVLDPQGRILGRVSLGSAASGVAEPRRKRGPRGLAHHPSAARLYVWNALSSTISVLDTARLAAVGEIEIPRRDGAPASVREGRGFLYDALLSGNGTMSCASCHVDGDRDGLSWDLGDPGGKVTTVADPVTKKTYEMHPMKGPMLTQSLAGLRGAGPFHWRGDRRELADFNEAFETLLGGARLAAADLAGLVAFLESIEVPPNPYRNLDGSLPESLAGSDPREGYAFFTQETYNGFLRCIDCHALPTGTNGAVFSGDYLLDTQPFKVASLRNLYRRTALSGGLPGRLGGFGLLHDGSLDDPYGLLSKPVFAGLRPHPEVKRELQAFVLAFDTGTAPAVGTSRTVRRDNVGEPALLDDLRLLVEEARKGRADLVGRGELDGRVAGLRFRPDEGRFVPDRRADPPFALEEILDRIRAGKAHLTFLGVPPGWGERLGVDRDRDGILDGDEDS
ncbi:MAG: beta-propeller fold lactonase family protein [Planctomycetes bacterium]|nr:beta-propeller fold lactonase family protein [Planctomycetota bacterium]